MQGYTITLTEGEVILLLMICGDYAIYRRDEPFQSRLSTATVRRYEALMDNLARWLIVAKEGEHASQANRQTWQQLAFPTPKAGVE